MIILAEMAQEKSYNAFFGIQIRVMRIITEIHSEKPFSSSPPALKQNV